MIRALVLFVVLGLASSAMAQELSASGFHNRFELVKNSAGETIAIRLKRTAGFSLRPVVELIKRELLAGQNQARQKGQQQYEAEVDRFISDLGLDASDKSNDENARTIRESLLNVPAIAVEDSFKELNGNALMGEFEGRMQNVMLQLDLSVMANLDDARFFYRRNVAYEVVTWALEQAKKRFSNVPVLNLASYVIVKVHDMLLEQRLYHHNMMLHYIEKLPESELGMTKEEVNRAISSIYEYRITATNYFGSNAAANDWDRYGWNQFYMQVRAGNTRVRDLASIFAAQPMKHIERLDFAFSEFEVDGSRKIYHLLNNANRFSGKPALAYDFAEPNKIKRNRMLLGLAQMALGFIPKIPAWLKGQVDGFIDSIYVPQRRTEGALVAHFEMNGKMDMARTIHTQGVNPYILE